MWPLPKTTRTRLRELVAPSSAAAYERIWRRYSGHAAEYGYRSALEAPPEVLISFVFSPQRDTGYATKRKEKAAIEAVFEAAGIPDASPIRTEEFERAWNTMVAQREGASAPVGLHPADPSVRTVPGDWRPHPLLGEVLQALPETPAGLRDRAMLSLAAAAELSRAELVGLRVEDVAVGSKSTEVRVPSRRVARRVIVEHGGTPCPSVHLLRWLAASHVESGPLFRPVSRRGVVEEGALTRQALTKILKRAARLSRLGSSSVTGDLLKHHP